MIAISITIFVILFLAMGIRVVPSAEEHVYERLGKFNKTLTGGLNWVIPLVDVRRARYNKQEQLIEIDQQPSITRDNVTVSIDGVVYMKFNDAFKATYAALNVRSMIAQLAQTTLRGQIGRMDLDETLSSRDEINKALLMALTEAAAEWGVQVTRVEVKEIGVSESVRLAMESQMTAVRDKRAMEARAEGEKNAAIMRAQGVKESERLRAEGERDAINAVNEAFEKNPQAAEYILSKDRIAAFAKIAESNSTNKVIVPSDFASIAGALGAFTELTKK